MKLLTALLFLFSLEALASSKVEHLKELSLGISKLVAQEKLNLGLKVSVFRKGQKKPSYQSRISFQKYGERFLQVAGDKKTLIGPKMTLLIDQKEKVLLLSPRNNQATQKLNEDFSQLQKWIDAGNLISKVEKGPQHFVFEIQTRDKMIRKTQIETQKGRLAKVIHFYKEKPGQPERSEVDYFWQGVTSLQAKDFDYLQVVEKKKEGWVARSPYQAFRIIDLEKKMEAKE